MDSSAAAHRERPPGYARHPLASRTRCADYAAQTQAYPRAGCRVALLTIDRLTGVGVTPGYRPVPRNDFRSLIFLSSRQRSPGTTTVRLPNPSSTELQGVSYFLGTCGDTLCLQTIFVTSIQSQSVWRQSGPPNGGPNSDYHLSPSECQRRAGRERHAAPSVRKTPASFFVMCCPDALYQHSSTGGEKTNHAPSNGSAQAPRTYGRFSPGPHCAQAQFCGRPVRAGVSQIRACSPPAKVDDDIAQITSAMVEVARRAGSRRL
jgi:hypothetical protein